MSIPCSLLGFPVVTLSDVAKNLGLGATSARNLAVAGLLGEPVAQVGRTKLFDAARADEVVSERVRARAVNQRAPFAQTKAALAAR